MIIKIIEKNRIATGKDGKSVILNFNKILGELQNLEYFIREKPNNFLLAHWNKILELPAFFCPQTQKYLVEKSANIQIESNEHYWLEIDNHNILPSCVLFYPNASMKVLDGKLIIYPV
jgi:hypothetical protein